MGCHIRTVWTEKWTQSNQAKPGRVEGQKKPIHFCFSSSVLPINHVFFGGPEAKQSYRASEAAAHCPPPLALGI